MASTAFGGQPMAIFTGTTGSDTITPGFVSAGVTTDGASAPSAAADLLNAGDGNDTLDGGGGNDALLGGTGDDLMLWNIGGGTDTFEGGDNLDTASITAGSAD